MRMKKVLMMACALLMGASGVSAQETTLLQDGDLFQGLTRSITYDRMIPPHGLQVTFDKTVHIIFPASVTYVDLGSANIMAGKADGAENVIRRAFGVPDEEGVLRLPGVVSRKKQFIPALMEEFHRRSEEEKQLR